jgi:hypothetical protein
MGGFLKSPQGGNNSAEMQLPIRSPTPVSAAAAAVSSSSISSSVSPLMGPTPSKAAAGMLDVTGRLPDSSSRDSSTAAAADGGFTEPEDVAAERVRVAGLSDYEGHPIVVKRLNKTYPGQDGQPPKVCVCGGGVISGCFHSWAVLRRLTELGRPKGWTCFGGTCRTCRNIWGDDGGIVRL